MLKQRLWLAIAAVALGGFLAYAQGRKSATVRSLPPREVVVTPAVPRTIPPPSIALPCTPEPEELESPTPTDTSQPPSPDVEPVAPKTVAAPAVAAKPLQHVVVQPAVLPSSVIPRERPVSDVPLVLPDSDRLWRSTFDRTQTDSDKDAIAFDLPGKKTKGPASGLEFAGPTSIGWKESLLKNDNTVFRGRFGGALSSAYSNNGNGSSSTEGTSDDVGQVPEVVFGLQFERRIDARNKILGEMEFGHDVTEFDRSRVRTKAAWEILLNEEKNLSLRTGLQEQSTRTSSSELTKELDCTLDVIWKF